MLKSEQNEEISVFVSDKSKKKFYLKAVLRIAMLVYISFSACLLLTTFQNAFSLLIVVIFLQKSEFFTISNFFSGESFKICFSCLYYFLKQVR